MGHERFDTQLIVEVVSLNNLRFITALEVWFGFLS